MVQAVIIQATCIQRGFDQHIEQLCPHLKLVGRAGSVSEGIDLIRNHRPNLVLLDVELPDGSGFEVFEATRDLEYEKIILSEEKRYVFKAVRFDVADYLVKPLRPHVLRNSLEKLVFARKEGLIQKMYHQKFGNSFPVSWLYLEAMQGSMWLNVHSMAHLHNDGVLRHLSLFNGQALHSSFSLRRIARALPESSFFRLNDQDIVHLSAIKEVEDLSNQTLVRLFNGTEIAMETTLKNNLLRTWQASPEADKYNTGSLGKRNWMDQ